MSARSLIPLSVLLALSAGLAPGASAHPGETYSPAPAFAPTPGWYGRITVTNTAGGPVTLSIEGLPARKLATWETATLAVPPGQRRVKVAYVQFGVEHVLENRRLDVQPTSSAYFSVRAERNARVLVRNNYDLSGAVRINGRDVALLAPHEARVLTTTAGNVFLEMTVGNRVVDQKQLNLVPFAEPTWTVDPPRVADLVVSNPLPIPVVLTCDRGLVRTLGPRSQTVYDDVPLGTFHLTARRVTGEYVDDATSAIRYDVANVWRVDAPATGLVNLDNNNPIPSRVLVDGTQRASLAPGVDSRLALPLGWHEIAVIDMQNRRVLDNWVEVRPYDTTELRFGGTGHMRAEDHHDDGLSARDDRDHDDHDDRDHDDRDHDDHDDQDGRDSQGNYDRHEDATVAVQGCSLPQQ